MTKFKKVTTLAQAKKDVRVSDIYQDNREETWWLDLHGDYICIEMEGSSIHEDTLQEVLHLLNTSVVHRDVYVNGNIINQ
jgi:hypothetical protein